MSPRVLIVDDEAPIRRLLQAWVEGEGAVVLQAGTAEQGLDLVRAEGAPAAALCDMRLPGKDGIWLAGQLRLDYPETAVVMTTAGNELDERRRQIMDAAGELELNAASSLEVLIEILHARDRVSSQHAHRVARLAVNLALTLEISEPHLSDIERAALLHNIGRLVLPDDLLTKPHEALSAEERARLRAYPLRGQAILSHAPFLAAAAAIAVATHERYDGSGFPDGLKGEAIPLGARIIGVADAYDELTSGIGREAVTPGEAIETLSTARAAEFDPVVLGALEMLHPTAAQG